MRSINSLDTSGPAIQLSNRSLRPVLIACLGSFFLASCGEDTSDSASQPEEPAPEVKVEERKPFYLAEERFDYEDGKLRGNQPVKGFSSGWFKSNKGTVTVSEGIANIEGPTRLSMILDVSDIGPFRDYIDDEGFIGKDGTTIYMSYYQQLIQADPNLVNLVEIAKGGGDIHETTQFNTGNDTDPGPVGPFGLRVKRNASMAIPAPDEINRRENLIVLRIKFGSGNRDEISYYYNPTPDDEDNPQDSILADDLSFDRVGLACFRGGAQRVRHMVLTNTFEDAAMERVAD